ncbi:MAG: hypothetical protein NZ531_05985 [Aquificaceae bacterium]|nr:hypothetical protein [Aquificaceae bacterium]
MDLIDPSVATGAYQLTPQQKARVGDWAQKQGVVPFVVTIGKIEAHWHVYTQSYLLSGSETVDSPLRMNLLIEKVCEKLRDEEWTKEQAIWALANSIIHELSHLMGVRGVDHKPTNPRCVAEGALAPHFLGPINNPFRNPRGQVVYLPWHDLENEVNRILSFMKYPTWPIQ